MSKLASLREWFDIGEAAEYLSIAFGEDVSEADIYRLVIDKRLTISLRFVNSARGRYGEVMTRKLAGSGPGPFDVCFLGEVLAFKADMSAEPEYLEGIYDIEMVATGAELVEHQFQSKSNGPDKSIEHIGGTYVRDDESRLIQLRQYVDWIPDVIPEPSSNDNPEFFPPGAEYVIRMSNLRKLVQSLETPALKKSASGETNTRRTLTYSDRSPVPFATTRFSSSRDRSSHCTCNRADWGNDYRRHDP